MAENAESGFRAMAGSPPPSRAPGLPIAKREDARWTAMPIPPGVRRASDRTSGTPSQRIARVVLATALVLLGLWIVHRFLPALAWATILAIALWPLYRRVMPASSRGGPAGSGAARPDRAGRPDSDRPAGLCRGRGRARERQFFAVYRCGAALRPGDARLAAAAARRRLPVRRMVAGQSERPAKHARAARPHRHAHSGQSASRLGGEVIHRLIIFGFTLLTLFFLFRDGAGLSRQPARA